MQRSWREKNKSRKKSKYRKDKGQNWTPENEDATYGKVERQKRHHRKEKIEELDILEEAELIQ
jgi:hypothetical protein